MSPAGRIRDEDVEEVRRRAGLIEIAGEYMQVKRAGRVYKALCPFHNEKTPSFSLDPAKQLFYCFGCHEGGDVYRLVQKLESMSFTESVEHLARKVGYEVRHEQLSAADRAALKRRARLIEAHRAAAAFYHDTLKKAPEAADARAYLINQRKFTTETLERFQVGFSPSTWDALCKHLRAQAFTEEELIAAGLASQRQEGGILDRFRGRVMFPIFDITGEPVAFGARRMGEGDGPKYLNSAESPIYKKAQVLYALNLAKGEVVKKARALIVEGYTDVIALHQAGITDAVATCGTALGLEHLRTLQRFTQQLTLSLDADDAGGTAAERTYDQLINEAQTMGLSLKVVLMPRGDDPADSVNKIGADGFAALISGAVPLLEFVLKREADRYTVGDPEVRARALASGLRLLSKTNDEVVRNEYARRLSGWIKVDPDTVHLELGKVMRSGAPPRAIAESVLKRSSKEVRLEKEALKLAIQFPVLVKKLVEDTPVDTFSVPSHRAIWTEILESGEATALADADDEAVRRTYTELAVQPVVGEATERLAGEVFTRLKEFVLTRQIDELKGRLQRINPLDEPADHERLFEELIELERRKRALGEGEEG
jgi:DNA primase